MDSHHPCRGSSNTVVLHVTMRLKPEHEQDFIAFATEVVGKVHAGEPGALTYALHRHPTDANTFVWIERYLDAAAVDAHMAAPYMAEAKKNLALWLAAPPTFVKLTQLLPA